ncbi:IS1182 family transposase [Paenibacillus sp. HWE-109]|uniref:IS1182 family transposase n=1 Tax=Paenibacillus sp. HWE-109 TaxID=1306526 RepID=UPI001EDDA35E|nr:IS1182 family transposase [Paenibacillus sp. HWE-109]UKS27094.1 IS1182 family transposase [Paenibacillus sp. HWE-109]UKS27095.1 IS1182 family transposase [Paenibacillus sp. HWE-109]
MAKFKAYTTEQGELLPIYLSEWVTDDHEVRLVSDIVEQLDLSAITNKYSKRGEEAYHPAMLLKLWFYGYATGVFTSRKLQIATKESIPFRWLCGGYLPDFRTLSDFRKNHLDTLPGLFKQVIQIAMELGYISLGHVSIDGSKIKASASKHKSMSRERMQKRLVQLEDEVRQALEYSATEEMLEEPHPTSPSLSLEERYARIAQIKSALENLEEQRPAEQAESPQSDQFNFTDADSRIMSTRNQGVIQGYNPQIAVDSDHGFIVGLQMSNQTTDQQQFENVLHSMKTITGDRPQKLSADAGYFSATNIAAAQEAEVDAYIAADRENKKKNNAYDKTNFTYVPESDYYLCPAGQELTLKRTVHANDAEKPTTWVYECSACSECPFRDECVKSKTGKRSITRSEHDPLREEMRTKVQSDEGKAVYRMRKAIVEPIWGQLKEVQGFRQFHLRGEDKVSGEFILLSLSHNIRKLHAAKYPKPATLYKRERSARKQRVAG